jgi:hypothetical protein
MASKLRDLYLLAAPSTPAQVIEIAAERSAVRWARCLHAAEQNRASFRLPLNPIPQAAHGVGGLRRTSRALRRAYHSR